MGRILAFDRAAAAGRTFDADGRLHVVASNISRAAVNPYRGDEIPDWETLGLDPKKVYYLLRDPDELEKAAGTFNGVQLLSQHVPVDADDHQPDLVVGAVSNPVFEFPFLKADLVVWAKSAIDGIESGRKADLSAAYRYRAVLEPGIYEGAPFDARMVGLVGNHCSLVADGRVAGAVVGDAAMEDSGRAMPRRAAALARFQARFPSAARIGAA
jgi:hypothetical protein